MKRNILFLTALIGTLILEYSCTKDPAPPYADCDSKPQMEVVRLGDARIFDTEDGQYGLVEDGDSVEIDNLDIRIWGQTDFVFQPKPQVSSAAYAIAIIPPVFSVCWNVNEVRIQAITPTGVTDVTSKFSIYNHRISKPGFTLGSGKVPLEINQTFKMTPISMFFYPNEELDLKGDVKFTFTIVDQDNNEFMSTTPSIYLK